MKFYKVKIKVFIPKMELINELLLMTKKNTMERLVFSSLEHGVLSNLL